MKSVKVILAPKAVDVYRNFMNKASDSSRLIEVEQCIYKIKTT